MWRSVDFPKFFQSPSGEKSSAELRFGVVISELIERYMWAAEQGVSVSHTSNPPPQHKALLCSAPTTPAQLWGFWLDFMSPNCDWPGLLVASFHQRKLGPSLWLGHLSRARLSADLHLYRTVRDMSQVHPPFGWLHSQLTSTCPLGQRLPSPLHRKSFSSFYSRGAEICLCLPTATSTAKGLFNFQLWVNFFLKPKHQARMRQRWVLFSPRGPGAAAFFG